MKLNVSSIRSRLQKLEQYISELEKQQPITLETLKNDFAYQLASHRASLPESFDNFQSRPGLVTQ